MAGKTDETPAWMVTAADGTPAMGLADVYRSEDYGVATITLDQAEQNTALDFAEALERAGLTEDDAIVGSAYTQAEKESLLGVPFLIVTCGVSRDQVTGREYIVARVITKETPSRMVVITDGGTGFYAQMAQLIRERLTSGQPAWEGYFIGQGLRKSEYPVGKDGKPLTPQQVAAGVKPDSIGTTYYIA